MKILVCEYITAGGLPPPSPSLLREGDWMALNLMRDLRDLAPHITHLMRARSNGETPLDPQQTLWIEPQDSFWKVLSNSVNAYDAVWPIAPETEGLLERLSATIIEAGGALLSCPLAGVRLTASKWACFERLKAFGVPVVPTQRLDRSRTDPAFPFPLVIKPDDGVGCEGLQVIESQPHYQAFVERHPEGDFIVQPLVSGESISYSALFLKGQGVLLACNRQRMKRSKDRLHLAGIEVNAISDPAGQHLDCLSRIAAALPELWGYAGVDLLIENGQPLVLEVNPRLTSAYPALREALGENPAAWVVDMYHQQKLPRQRAIVSHPVWAQW